MGPVNRGVVVMVAALLASSIVGCGDGDDDGGSPSSPDDTAAPGTPGETASSYVHPSGCIRFNPGEDWEQVEETGLGVDYSGDPDNPLSSSRPPGGGPAPGEPGVLVAANCAPLEQVGTAGPVPIPGFEVVDDRAVDFGGGAGRLVEYRIESEGVPPHTNLQVTVDLNDARCTLRVVGARDAIDAIRADVDDAIDSYICEGR